MADLKRLSELGRVIADVSDATRDLSTLPNARRRFLSLTTEDKAPQYRFSAKRIALAASFALACGALITAWVWPTSPAISFEVGEHRSKGSVGQWVAPTNESPLDVRFSEGSIVNVSPGGRLRITETHSDGADLLIERGTINAHVSHKGESTHWRLRAGPFEVRVTGTTFSARWNPETETFELAMIEGSVIVSGPRIPAGRAVVAGEQLIVSTQHMELRAGTTPASSASANVAVPTPTEVLPVATPAVTLSPAATSTTLPSANPVEPGAPIEATWKTLARAGKHKEAMAAAEANGFSAEIAKASPGELLTLADVARFSGKPAAAKEALIAARKRYKTKGATAFLLGKISADQLRSPGDAALWFETYLKEEPGGPLAEQALGRLLEIRKRDPGAARIVAERYLARYPMGAHAALARSLVEK
ncbi:MAG: FecR domain-containing protein [Polyangiaceae bacterium]|nr:FecR domain-containing protein [Polyangiaceae bacterium]